jgi:hypothetical protein
MARAPALLLLLSLLLPACGGSCPEPAAPERACRSQTVPTGRWTGEWESYPLDNPSFVRSGSLDLVVAEGGAMTGHTVEEEGLDRGTLAGKVLRSGELTGEYAVSRAGVTRRYTLSGSFVCDQQGIRGKGSVRWDGRQQGNLEFSLHPAP